MSTLILAIHTLMYACVALVTFFAPFVFLLVPTLPGQYLVAEAVVLTVVVPISWRLWGACPFTLWENQLRIKEKKIPYEGPCFTHYIHRWLGVRLPRVYGTAVPLVLLVAHVLEGMVFWK